MKKLIYKKSSAYFRMLRISNWIKFYPIFPILGAYLAMGISFQFFTVFLIFFCVIGYGFVINNYCDYKIDKQNSKKMHNTVNPLASGLVSKSETLGICMILGGASLVISFYISYLGFIFTILCLISLTMYSAKPFRLKDRYISDIICHGVMFGGLPFLTGYILAGGNLSAWLSLFILSAICTIICCEALIIHEILDYHEDLGTTPTTVTRTGLTKGFIILGITPISSIILFELIVYWYRINPVFNTIITGFLLIYPIFSCRSVILPAARKSFRICSALADGYRIR